ncbi:MAG: vitamin B12-dependent ribonucleotide reductase, partial [Armatimonadetes bacterium]|nr:vitamin B12-dependent ribonucleotide reductase [Armatimonadota bacterium]
MASPTTDGEIVLPERIAESATGQGDIFAGEGLSFARYFTTPGEDVFATTEWDYRTSVISGEGGAVVFEQKDVEIPKAWSMLATNVVVSKYFRGKIGTPERESSVKQLVSRVADTIYAWGKKGNYFETDADADTFHDELKYLLTHQYMAFNSPVWFNLGVVGERPQVSACFINSVEDTMESILTLAKTEGMLFKWGSGTGTNISVLRSSNESLKGGGTASGPVSFMRGFDAFAGAVKSGGKTRRAAKMVILNTDHPDIEEFVECKADSEKKAHALIEAGYSGAFNVPNGAYDSVYFQNANHSVRATDDFMRAVELDRDWSTREVTTGNVTKTFKARELMRKMAEATWVCGDPGMQFDTTANRWHTCPNTGRINASNPCSEFFFLDDTACNLASLNLMKFRTPSHEFDVEMFRHAVRVTATAQEIMVGNAAYPTDKITINSHDYRPLGLGYANLGALL